MKQNINSNIVILGGGAAGWLTALFVKKIWKDVSVTVVEDPNRPPIIAGESGTTTFTQLLRRLDIDVEDFVKQTNATPKLGGRFKNWNGVGSEFIHCLQTDFSPWLTGFFDENDNPGDASYLGQLSRQIAYQREKDLYLATLIGNDIPLAKAFYANQFIEQNRVPFGYSSELPCIPMWHFESRTAAAYFKNIALGRDIILIEGEYQTADQKENGNITSIKLTDGRSIDGDWFFDCSGFARLLLGKVLLEPVIDFTNYFPARSVVAWWSDPCTSVTTNANAMEYGWSWNINLRHRSGNGYIYDPDHINVDQAIIEAEKFYGYKIDPVANFSFVPGIMKQPWKNNVIAIGLSSGFLEPLEANGVQVIIDSLWALEDIWKPFELSTDQSRRDTFNHRVVQHVDDIKDFLALHYRGHRRDTEFWRSHANDKTRIPPSLLDKLEAWKQYYHDSGITSLPFARGYSPTAWLMVIQALKLFDPTKVAKRHKNVLAIGQDALNRNYTKYKELCANFKLADQWLKDIE
jgi:tryptophan halogenase